MSHIFISYSHKDKECVSKVARMLEGRGYQVWMDTAIPSSSEFGVQIDQHIGDALTTLLFWSKDAAESAYVRQEYELANQKKRQYPAENRRIFSVMLDKTPLPELLSGNQYVPLYQCSVEEINHLIDQIATDKRMLFRRFNQDPFPRAKTLSEQVGANSLDTMPELVRVPFMDSVHCHAAIIGRKDTCLSDILSHPDHDSQRVIQVYLQFMFSAEGETSIQQVINAVQAENLRRADRAQPPYPLFMLHITGPQNGGNYELGDSTNGSWQGQWLDAVNSTYAAVVKLIGDKGARLQLFNAVPASLNFAVGTQFFKYWDVQLYHFTRDKRYQLVLNTDEL